MFTDLTTLLTLSGVILAALLTIGILFARLYVRASKEVSFVRTGLGGQRVIMDGGALVLPVLHEVIPVNMNTLRLAVKRASEQALITRDRMRVDVVAEFYVRCQPTAESIANAAQTLGQRTMHPQELKDLVEGKFVDALRSVAAELTMEELHEKRTDFVQKVQQVVTEDLLKNGLELESVSLTGLDQTSKDYFNPNNAFDAEGLTKLTLEIERRRKIRNDIEQETQVQITEKNLEAEKQRLELSREEEYARLKQQREIEIRRAEQAAEIARQKAEQEKAAEQAEILANQQVEASKIEAQRALEKQRIEKERLIKTQDVERIKSIELAEQDKAIAIAEKSKQQSDAQAQASQAKAKAVQAQEHVITVKEQEIAERQKQIELIEAAQQAEREAITIKVAAEAEKLAALDNAEALKTQAQAEAEKLRITAVAEADAEKIKAEAQQMTYQVEAEGLEAVNQAKNMLSAEQVAMQIKLNLIDKIDSIIRESVKPLENIDGIKIMNVGGLANTTSGSDSAGDGNVSFSDQVVNSALKYRAQAPMVDSLLKEIGIDGANINSVQELLEE